MSASRIRWCLPALLVAVASAAAAPITVHAQAPAHPDRPDPLDAQAPVAPLQYRSGFGDYRRLADEPVGSWSEANDRVGRIGGWKVYAREASEPDDAGERAGSDERPAGTPGQAHGVGHERRGAQ
ncbi:MAG: hypothetical protein EHM83_06960 [Burkholderiales bacterium]|nr:MAG: hypothetical protein EHM83_06960 [Burkholderiales bacterium]